MLFDINNLNKKITYFNELELNGENVDDEDDVDDYTAEEPEEDDPADDDAPVEDDPADDELDDYTEEDMPEDDEEAPADDEGGEDEPPAEDDAGGDDTEVEDFTQDTPDDAGGDAPAGGGGDTGGDADTAGEDDAADEGENEDAGNDDNDASNDDESMDDDSAEDQSLADMEKNLFSDLSPQQMSIKNAELLQNYINLFESLTATFENINKINKTYSNTRIVEFIADKVVELKDMVNYIITTTYVTKTYVENLTTYKQCLLIMQQINTMLKGLVNKPALKKTEQ